MTEDPSTKPASCATCNAPLEPDALCLACTLESALTPGIGVWEEESATSSIASKNGFGDFAPPAGGIFGKYRLNKELGSGGMGVIWEAEDTSLHRTVAIKMIRGFAFSSAGVQQRFQREATAVAQLDHPNIVPIYEVGEIEGQPYFAMKQLVGGTLSTRLANGAMDQRETAVIMEKLARAIAHAHERGILHRDLKPDNVLFDNTREPHLTDFGLAKMLDEGDGLTLTTAHVGTPHYMSPEQARGRAKDITAASDVWGAGALLFHMLTGQTPFAGKSSGEIFHHVANDPPRSMDDAVPAVDKDLQTLCLRCLERDPGHRVPSAEVLAEELGRWLDGHPIATKPASLATKARNWIRHQPVQAAALAFGLLLIAIVAVGFFLNAKGKRVLTYGDTISLRNLAHDEYLDTCGWVQGSELGAELRSQNLFVFASKTLNRGDRPTGTWLIEPSGDKEFGKSLSFGDTIHLRNMYPGGGWLDNCGNLEHLHYYDEFAQGQQYAVSTSMKYRASDQTDKWIVRSPHGKTGPVEIGDAIVLDTAFAGGGHLNASGQASSIEAFNRIGFEDVASLVFVSDTKKAVAPSGQWEVQRTDGRLPKKKENNAAKLPEFSSQRHPDEFDAIAFRRSYVEVDSADVAIVILEDDHRLYQRGDHGVEVHVSIGLDGRAIMRNAEEIDFDVLERNGLLEPKLTRGWFSRPQDPRSDLRAIHFEPGVRRESTIWVVRSKARSCWTGPIAITMGDENDHPFFRVTKNLIPYGSLGTYVRVSTTAPTEQPGTPHGSIYLSNRGWLELCWTGDRGSVIGSHMTYFLPMGTSLQDLGLRPGTSASWEDDVFGKVVLIIQPKDSPSQETPGE